METMSGLRHLAMNLGIALATLLFLTGCQSPTLSSGQPLVGQPQSVQGSASTNVTHAAAPPLQRGIVVNGTGSVSARPDRAVVSAGVQKRATSAQEAHDATSQAMQGVIGAIKGLGISEQAIRTGGVSLYPMSDDKNTITGYVATNTVTVTLDNVDQAGPVLDAAVKAGANTADNVQFTLKDPSALRHQALSAAVADARAKAAVLAEAAGVTLPSLESISEGGMSEPQPLTSAGMGAAASAPTMPIEPGQITVTANVTVAFASPSP